MVYELTENNLSYQCKQYRLRRRVHFFSETASTNDIAKQLCAENKGANAVVVADCQTAGRGRLDRSFVSPKGTGLYLSAVFTLQGNEKHLELLSSLAGLAVRDSLYNLYDLQVGVKWPNDVMYEGKKLCGILCEIVNLNNRPKFVVVGIGINTQRGAFPDDVAGIAGAISEFYTGEIDRNELCAEILHNLDRYIVRSGALLRENNDILTRIKACSISIGQRVRVVLPDEDFEARVLDILPNGALLVDDFTNGERIVSAGEIVHML